MNGFSGARISRRAGTTPPAVSLPQSVQAAVFPQVGVNPILFFNRDLVFEGFEVHQRGGFAVAGDRDILR